MQLITPVFQQILIMISFVTLWMMIRIMMDTTTIRMISQKMILNGSIQIAMELEIMLTPMMIMILGRICGKNSVVQIVNPILASLMISILI